MMISEPCFARNRHVDQDCLHGYLRTQQSDNTYTRFLTLDQTICGYSSKLCVLAEKLLTPQVFGVIWCKIKPENRDNLGEQANHYNIEAVIESLNHLNKLKNTSVYYYVFPPKTAMSKYFTKYFLVLAVILWGVSVLYSLQ